MEQKDERNTLPEQPEDIERRVRQLSLETARAQDSAKRALSETEQIRWNMQELQDARQTHGRSLAGLWSFFVLLLLAACALGWYWSESTQGFEKQVADLPKQADYEKAVQAVNKRVDAAEGKLTILSRADWKGFGERLNKVEQRFSADMKLVREFAQAQASHVHQQLVSEIDNRTAWVEMHIARMESTDEAQRVKIAALQEELAGVRAQIRKQNEQIEMVRQDSNREMDGLYQRVAATRGDLDALAWESAKERVDFELNRDATNELIPGVTLTLKNTNVPYQRIEEGYVHVVGDGRYLWIRSHGIQQPVIFYTQHDQRPYQLVFTRITRDGAVGYLVHPGGPPEANRASGPLPAGAELSASVAEAR